MRTVRCSDHRRGVYLPREVYLSRGNVPARGCTCPGGCTRQEGGTSPAGVCIPACTEADTPHSLWTEWLIDTMACPHFTHEFFGVRPVHCAWSFLSNQRPCCVCAASQWVHKTPYQLSCVIISVDRAVAQELMFQRNRLEHPSKKIILRGCYRPQTKL